MFYRRIFRELKANKARYFMIFLILAVVLTMVVENIMAASSVKDQMTDYLKKCNVEDGEFITVFQLTDEQKDELSDKGAELEEQFYADYEYSEGVVLRVFGDRENINLLNMTEGSRPNADDDIVIENRFAQAHGISTGDKVEVGRKAFNVTGIATVPDYVAIKKNISDLSTDNELFGLSFVTADTYKELYETGNAIQEQTLTYTYKLSGNCTSNDVRRYVRDMEIPEMYKLFGVKTNLMSMMTADDNERITGYSADVSTTMSVSIMMGILMAVLIAFVISIFETHTIECESVIVGTLYSLGVRKKDLMKQYVLLPVIVIALGGIGGILLGYALCPTAIEITGEAYSFPAISAHFYPIAIVFGVVLPTFLGFLVNYFVISKKLNREPLDLLKGTRKSLKPSKRKLNFKKFANVYRARQFLREKGIYIVLFIGVYYSVCIMLFAFTIYSALSNYVNTCTDDVKWSYMYTMKQMPDEKPEETEYQISQKLSSYNVYSDGDVTVTLFGVPEDSKFFDFNLDIADGEVIISDCAAKKFDWSTGDHITLKNDDDETEHQLTVKAVVKYSAGLYLFMPMDNMREEFDIDEDYYNVIFSDSKLDDLETSRIWGLTSREDISKAGTVLMDSMTPTVAVMLGAAIIVFVAVMYLLLNQTLEKASFSISLIKIFGYTENEVRKIFIDANFAVVFIAALLAFLMGKPVIDKMYPNLVTDINLGFDTSFTLSTSVIAVIIIAATYFVSMLMLNSKLKKMDYTEVLKNRE